MDMAGNRVANSVYSILHVLQLQTAYTSSACTGYKRLHLLYWWNSHGVLQWLSQQSCNDVCAKVILYSVDINMEVMFSKQ